MIAKLPVQCRGGLAVAVRLARRARVRDGDAAQREGHVIGWGGSAGGIGADDVGADPQPIRRKVGVANPGLQVTRYGHAGRYDRLWRGEEQKVAVIYQHFRQEEIASRAKSNRSRERNRDLYF